MLTPAQVTFYGQLWGRACKANGWRMDRGRLQGRTSGSEILLKIFALGQQHALANSRAANVEDLRRACTAHAAGRFCSTKDLTNREFDSLISLLKLLADESDIGASMRLDNPAIGERERLVLSIRKRAPEAKTLAIARNLKTWSADWEPPHWENLPVPGLRLLLGILAREQKKFGAPEIANRQS
jgi:hypothetical protein